MQINSNKNLFITERIVQYLNYKNITKYKFCKDLGLSNGFLDKGRDISTSIYANIIAYFPELNGNWLLTGQGNMLRESDDNSNIKEPISEYRKQSDSELVNKLLDRLQKQSEELGKLRAEIAQLKRGDFGDAQDVGVAAAG